MSTPPHLLKKVRWYNGPHEYEVASIDGDYAVLRRTDNDTHDEILVARALLPEEIDIGTALHYEMFTYSIV